jgi:arabinose-5-phosphate isomerase
MKSQLKQDNAALTADREAAIAVLRLEAAALTAQAEALGLMRDDAFDRALDTVINLKGRLIISGMGKAGHVARKIAATCASTGTPASFVHPAEASHGDLGMITDQDAVLLLSKSGESAELRDIVTYCKRFSIPLLAMTAAPHSTLGQQADVLLTLVNHAEACPNQQAPTTSTILMMAMGDALAVALMKRRGFSATDFRQYHPGGKLGGQLLSVKQVMKQGAQLPLVPANNSVFDAQKIMSAHNFGCAIAVNADGTLAGFLTDGDLRRHLGPDLLLMPIVGIMNKTPRSIAHDALCSAAIAFMNQHNITQLIVTDGATPVGLLRLHDILRAGVA